MVDATNNTSEFATLQGFPREHQFFGPARRVVMKQIGNAFPPIVAKVFFEAIRKSLEAQDRGHGAQAVPGYSLLNGNLDEDEALQAAMRESLAHTRRPTYIDLDSSDNEEELRGSMGRLTVEPSASTRRPVLESPETAKVARWLAAVANSSTPRTPTHRYLSRKRSSSTASSHTPITVPAQNPLSDSAPSTPRTVTGAREKASALRSSTWMPRTFLMSARLENHQLLMDLRLREALVAGAMVDLRNVKTVTHQLPESSA